MHTFVARSLAAAKGWRPVLLGSTLLFSAVIGVGASGAVSAAPVFFKKLPAGLKRVGVILSGGNVDYELLASL